MALAHGGVRHDGAQRRSAASAHGLAALPLAGRLAVSRGLGADLPAYRVSPVAGGLLARNVREGFSARFDRRGVTFSLADHRRLAMGLSSISFGAQRRTLGATQPVAHANRISYRRAGLEEWYANGPLGVEQGFDVEAPPVRDAGHLLTLTLGLSGSLRARLDDGALLFTTAGRRQVLRYDGLSATDARGRAVPVRMKLSGRQLSILIDTRAARYPLKIDPLVQSAELDASDGALEDFLGSSVAVSGTTVVAGASNATVGGVAREGAVYVFTEGPGGWADATQTAKLVPSNGEAFDGFGGAVAISGQTIVVGDPGHHDGSGASAGAAYVYNEPVGGWGTPAVQTQSTELLPGDGVALYEFGRSVAISGDTIAVGSPFWRNYEYASEKNQFGAVYVFDKPAGGWGEHAEQNQTATLFLSKAEATELDHFGESVAIEGPVIVAGAPIEPINGEFRQGAVYVFTEPAGGWKHETETARLTASDGAEFDELGYSLAISGKTVVAGATFATVGANVKHAGAAYVFEEPPEGWGVSATQSQAAKLTASNPVEESHLGTSVAIDGLTILSTDKQGTYVFSRPAGGWSGEAHESGEFVYQGGGFENAPYAAAISGATAVAGLVAATPQSVSKKDEQGVVSVFLPDTTLYPPTVVTGPASGGEGGSVTLSGTVDANGSAVSSCSFEYGTSPSYGSVAPCAQTVGSEVGAVAVSASLSGLAPGTTYYYRVVATNTKGTGEGLPRTFTTPAAVTPGAPVSTSPGTSPASTPVTTTVNAPATTSAGNAPGALEATRALACTTAQVALIDVVAQGSHVLITGAARRVLVGRQVSIELLSTGKTVATPTVSVAGTFSATVPLPPAKGRGSNRTRYQASVGSLHSLALKLERRADFLHVTTAGQHVSIAGHVTGSFRTGTRVAITLRVTCAKYVTVATVKLSHAGTFSAVVPAPSGSASQIAVYRAATTVLDDGHPEPTYTLPTPPS